MSRHTKGLKIVGYSNFDRISSPIVNMNRNLISCGNREDTTYEQSLMTLDRNYNILDKHPKLKSQLLSSFSKHRPNKIGTSELKEAAWERKRILVKQTTGLSLTVDQLKTVFGISRGVEQQYGYQFQDIYASADGWDNLCVGNKTKCDLKNDSKKIVLELKAHNSTTTFKHQDREQKTGYNWAIENGYQYIYGIIDIDNTDKTYDGEDYIKEGIRTCTKKKLAAVIFGSEQAFNFIMEAYVLSSRFIKSS